MTEKEKMLKEMLYDANNDEDLLKERTIAKDLCFKFNQMMPSDVENQKKLLKELLGQVDDTTSILASFWCDYGYNIKVGKNFFANHNTVIIDCAPVTFGDNVFIAPNCGFYTAGHPIDTKRRNQGLEFAGPKVRLSGKRCEDTQTTRMLAQKQDRKSTRLNSSH